VKKIKAASKSQRVGFLCGCCAVFLTLSAHSAEQFNATQAYLNSFSDFYLQYKKSPDRSPRAAAQIAEKTIDPAYDSYIRTTWEYGKALLKDQFGYEAGDVSALRNNKALFLDPNDNKPQPDDQDKSTSSRIFSKQIVLDGADELNQTVTPIAPAGVKKQGASDNVVLDGSNIPTELEFRGPQKKKKP
jgi:hypothetical protein